MDRNQDETEQHIVRGLHRSLAPVELGINGVVIHSIPLTFLTIVKGIAGPKPTLKHSPRAVEGNDCSGKPHVLRSKRNSTEISSFQENENEKNPVHHQCRVALPFFHNMEKIITIVYPVHRTGCKLASHNGRKQSLKNETSYVREK
jgi:hypothetical protein